MLRLLVSPEQITAVPESIAVGGVFTVITADPEAVPVQFTSLTAVRL